MTGEVNRVLQLANTSIIPITWQVPRKRNENDNDNDTGTRRGAISV